MKNKNNIKVLVKTESLLIYINDTLHLSLNLRELVAVQSYYVSFAQRYYIDYYCKETKVDTWYTDKEIWKEILKQMVKIDLVI